MKKPKARNDVPPRNADNNKRTLLAEVTDARVAALANGIVYKGSPKHKLQPHLYDLEPYRGDRGDATLCDSHAKFRPESMETIGLLLQRGLSARLIGAHNLWTVGDDGWIFEGRLTNTVQNEWHGYPVRPNEAIAGPVYRRFREWAEADGSEADKQAAENCAALYRFR